MGLAKGESSSTASQSSCGSLTPDRHLLLEMSTIGPEGSHKHEENENADEKTTRTTSLSLHESEVFG